MTSPAAGKRRMDQDVIRLIESNHEVEITDSLKHFMVKFNGPKNTPYEGGMWKIRVMLPDDYPFKSPSIGFINRIFHPNIDEASGSVCLDVINQTWTPVFDLVNIFESFLPQLLTYPNAADPLNGEAASMLMSRPSEYERRIKEGVKKYATEEAFEKIRDKGTILSNPPNRSHRGGSTSSGTGFNNVSIAGGSNVAGDRGGGAHGLTSTSMPPAVGGFGRGSLSHHAAATTSVAATAVRSPAAFLTSDIRPSGESNNNSVLSNSTVTAAVANNSAAVGDDGGTAGAHERVRRNDNADDEAVLDADLLDGADDASEASDLSEFSENEADQMDL